MEKELFPEWQKNEKISISELLFYVMSLIFIHNPKKEGGGGCIVKGNGMHKHNFAVWD